MIGRGRYTWNIHVPQSIQTVTELRLIANAIKRFVSPATSKIAINAKQDTLMGSYVETKNDIMVDWKDAMNILMATSIGINSNIPKHKLISGKMLYSEIIQPGINIIKNQMKIQNGQILDGVFGKSEIATIVQKTWFQYGSNETQSFIDDLQRMILQFLMRHGYTVGIKDTVMPNHVHDSVYKIIETTRKEALGAITQYENDPYIMTSEAFETNLKGTLQAVQNDIQKTIMNNFNTENGIYICITSQSSGTDLNAGQIIGCIGQVIVEGKRIQKRFNNRTLPTFHQHDDSPFARGFCYNSFISGLNPMEFFFQVMAGREGIINTAIKTADKPQDPRAILHMCRQQVATFKVGRFNLKGKMVEISPRNRINYLVQ